MPKRALAVAVVAAVIGLGVYSFGFLGPLVGLMGDNLGPYVSGCGFALLFFDWLWVVVRTR